MHVLVEESPAFFDCKVTLQIIAYCAPFPPSLGSCSACLLQSHFNISSWQCCRCGVSHKFHQFGRVFSRCFHLECFWGLVYSKFVSRTCGVTTLFGSSGRWCWCGAGRGRHSWLWVCVWYCQILEVVIFAQKDTFLGGEEINQRYRCNICRWTSTSPCPVQLASAQPPGPNQFLGWKTTDSPAELTPEEWSNLDFASKMPQKSFYRHPIPILKRSWKRFHHEMPV